MEYWLITYQCQNEEKTTRNCLIAYNPSEWLLEQHRHHDEKEARVVLLFALKISEAQYKAFDDECNLSDGYYIVGYNE